MEAETDNYLENARVHKLENNNPKQEIRDAEQELYGFYNVEGYDGLIVKYRKESWGLQRILRFLVERMPVFDGLHLLCQVLRVLDNNNLAVSRREVLNCFNVYYHKEEHGDKRSYLEWIYNEFNIKHGTKVRTSQIRIPQAKTPIFSGISDKESPVILQENRLSYLDKGVSPETKENTEKQGVSK